MDQSFRKIFWRIGQEITPDTFIQADNYICSQHNLIRRLIAGKYYGLLPQTEDDTPSLTIEANLNNRDIYIKYLTCNGITEAGYLVQFDDSLSGSLPKRQLSLPNSNAAAFYVVMRINPYEQVLIEPVDNEEAPEAHSDYELCIRSLDQISTNELAILKVDNSQQSPAIDGDYIPTCMAVNSGSVLLEMSTKVKNLLADIRSIIEHKKDQFGKLMYPLSLLHYELNEFSLSEPPIALIRLIKKFMMTYQFFVPDIRMVTMPDSIDEYNHNDVAIIFKSLLSCLQEVKLMIGKVEIVIEEDFTPRI
jgi:hypothetical protein